MIASSLTCRVLRAVWLWLAALGQSSRVFGAIGRCYRASGTNRTLARWLGAEPRALASSRYTRAFTNENGVITVTMRHSDLPHTQKWIFEGDKLKVVPFCGGLLQTDYSLRRI